MIHLAPQYFKVVADSQKQVDSFFSGRSKLKLLVLIEEEIE